MVNMKSKLLTSLIIFFIAVFSSSAQDLQVVKELNSSYYELEELEINLSADKIIIARDNQNLYFEEIAGKKIFKSSRKQNFFLIANFKFSSEKVDYLIEIKVFDRMAKLIFAFEFLAPFDLPHPIFQVNDNAFLALFDPLSFKVTLVNKDYSRELKLIEDAPFEMEKASFMDLTEDFLFIISSQKALDVTESGSNTILFKIDISKLNFEKRELDYNTPTLLQIIDENLFISGVKFVNLTPIGRTIKYNFQLDQLAVNEIIAEKMLFTKTNLYAKYFNTIYEFGDEFSVVKKYEFESLERINALGQFNNKLVVSTNIAGENNLYFFSADLDVDFKAPLHNFRAGKIDDFSISKNHVIIRHDSTSTKLKINRN